ncbi:hypothetical protein LshimejAT787_2100950 [Lyophyllum shimeji]|uniref:Uncharacterized protein n=1 Tax=Lyophyllum shimeji TaxID=47721 RepID=A0A9P3Q0F1_LYOSH|nr:hypothetical protein LshimejAT787_2100950 [Lyophyllum shimeji]
MSSNGRQQLSAEICARIVRSLGSVARRGPGDLAALCRTCKAFQREAEVRLYDALYLSDPARAHLACTTVSANERLALLVRTFCFTVETRRPLTHSFWLVVKHALDQMHNLEHLVLYDSTFANGWVLEPTQIRFQLRDAKLRFMWDAQLVAFLEGQRKLQSLHTFDRLDDTNRVPPAPGSLPLLRNFDGTLMVGMQLLDSPLTHLQMMVDREMLPSLAGLLPRLRSVHKTLRSLSLLDVPEDLVAETSAILASVCPNLVYLGLIPLPPIHRHDFYHSLLKMHSLRCIQLDVLAWSPHPNIHAQRAIAIEMRVYCPSIHHVVFWIGQTRFRWQFVDDAQEWHSHVDTHQYPQFDNMWSLAWT